MMTISTVNLKAANGRQIRKVTKVAFANGVEITYTERMTKKQIARQLVNDLERAIARAAMNGDKAGEAKWSRALELALNATDFPKVSA